MTSESVRDIMSQVINRILTDSGRPARSLCPDDTLVGTVGLDSLDLAVLVVGLEQALGVDPFREGARPVPTYGQLVELYESTLRQRASVSDNTGAASERELSE